MAAKRSKEKVCEGRGGLQKTMREQWLLLQQMGFYKLSSLMLQREKEKKPWQGSWHCLPLSGYSHSPLQERMEWVKGSCPGPSWPPRAQGFGEGEWTQRSFLALLVIIHSAEDFSVSWELMESSRYQQEQHQKERKQRKERNLKQERSGMLEGQTNKLIELPIN